MNKLFTYIHSKDSNILKDFVLYYNKNYNKSGIKVEILLTLPLEFSIFVFLKYLQEIHNIGLYIDMYGYAYFYYNPNENKEEVDKILKKNNYVSYIIHKETNLKGDNILNSYYNGIISVVNYLTNEF